MNALRLFPKMVIAVGIAFALCWFGGCGRRYLYPDVSLGSS